MRAFHLMLLDELSSEPRRVDFTAEGPDHAFQIARNEKGGILVELWEAERLLAWMTKEESNIWKLLPTNLANENRVIEAAQRPLFARI